MIIKNVFTVLLNFVKMTALQHGYNTRQNSSTSPMEETSISEERSISETSKNVTEVSETASLIKNLEKKYEFQI